MKENPFNVIRMTGYLIFLMAFGSYFKDLTTQSLWYILALTVTTLVATKIILLTEDLIIEDKEEEEDPYDF